MPLNWIISFVIGEVGLLAFGALIVLRAIRKFGLPWAMVGTLSGMLLIVSYIPLGWQLYSGYHTQALQQQAVTMWKEHLKGDPQATLQVVQRVQDGWVYVYSNGGVQHQIANLDGQWIVPLDEVAYNKAINPGLAVPTPTPTSAPEGAK